MRRINNKTLGLIIMIICCFFFQTTAYSIISSSLTITGDAIARIRNNVRINDFRIHEVSDGVISSYEEFSKFTTTSNVTLPNSDSYIIYKLVIGNYENVEMQLSNITGLSSNLTYELIDYALHDMICDTTNKCTSGAEMTIYIKIKYASYDSLNTNYNVNLNYEFREFSNVLMIGSEFKNTIPSTATHLVFTDEKPAQGTVLTDVSAAKDMGVVGYLDGTTYKVSTRRTGYMPEANTDSSYMFNGALLTNIDLDNLDISSTTNIIGMFQDCTSLVNINFGSDWDTSNITDMKYLFKNCSSLPTIDLSGFNTSKVTSFSNFFNGCSSLTSLDVSGFDTSKSSSFGFMFRDCSKLTVLDVSKFNTSKAITFQDMFYNCSLLEIIDVSGFDTSNVTTMASMFYNCYSVLVLDVSGFDTSNVTTMASMFQLCKKVKELDLGHFVTDNVTSIQSMFTDCNSLLSLDIKDWNMSNNRSLYATFNRCWGLTELDLSNWDVSSLTICYWVFTESKNITTLNLSGWKFKNNLSLSGMFFGLHSIENLDVSNWDVSMVTAMDKMFENCLTLKKLDLSSWNTSSVTSTLNMFKRCDSIENIYVGENWNVTNVSTSEDMFCNCNNLPNFDSTVVDVTKAYVGDGGYLSYKTSNMTINGTTYEFRPGMTWGEWYDSEYNTFLYDGRSLEKYTSYFFITYGDGYYLCNSSSNSDIVSPDDVIISDKVYYIVSRAK